MLWPSNERKGNQGTGGDERDQLQAIRESIVVSQDPENDLISVQNSRFEGTCTWIVRKPSFVSWKYSTAARPTVFWIKGHPATGKSVLAGFAIDHLKSEGLLCSYFFFRHGDKLKSRSGDCLRSLAYQMACADPLVRKELVGLLNDGRRFDIDSDQVLWRKIFVNGILQRDLSRHCWVIDGLDECSNPTSFLNTILGKQDTASSLKVLVTSRESTELGRNFAALCPGHLTTQLVSPSETLGDIKSYATCKIQSFLEGSDAREALVEKVVEKSQGSFLWTVLVLEGLSTTYGEEEMKQVLEEVPLGMDALYSRTITTMSSMARGKKLATVILRWAVCCTRPLTINELETALSLELKDNFSRIKQSITSLCGQLVTVNNADQVLMIHETAREFLLDESLESEFAINRLSCHTSLARCCLDYLNSDEMKPPRSTRRQSSSARTKPRAEFSKYACSAFSYHLAKSDARANDLLKSVYTFLRGNVLSWIESIARSSSILLLVVTAKNLKTYFNACAIERSPLSRELQTVLGWTTDLIRIAAKFGDALVLAPSAIYSQVPAFCPQETFIHKAAPSSNIFSVLGLSQRTWDGRLANFEFHTGQASAIVYGGKHIAVGLASGTITVYHAMTFQKHLVLDHSEAVKYIAFTQSSDELVSCSMKSIRVWNLRTGNLTRSFSSPPNPMGMVIDGERLIVPARRNFIATWDLKHDCQREHDISWANSDESRSQNVLGVTSTVSISTGHKVLAAGYPDRDILLWDLEENTYMGSCGRQQVHPLQALVLNPNPSLDFLVASYLDGELFLIDPFRNETIARIHANCQTLAASADGRFLAGSPGSGFIQIYEFDTLRMIYRVQAGMYFVKQVTFSEDGFHLADIRGKQCNVWEPSVLLRAIQGDDSSEGTLGADVEAVSVESKNKITSMATNNSDDSIICGKDDGSVDVYNRHTGAWVKTLWKHKSRVSMLCWCCNSRRLISADDSNSIIAWEVQKSSTEGLLAVTQLFHQYIGVGGTVMQVLPRETSEAIIFASWMSDYLMTWEGEKLQEIQSQVEDTSGIHSWVQHPTSTEHAVRLDGRQIQLFTWKELKCIQTVHFDGYHAGQTLRGVFCYQSTADKEGLLLFELLGNRNSAAAPKLIIVDLMNMIGEEEVGAVSSQETTDSAPALGRLSLSVGPCRTLSCTFDRILRILDVDHGTGRVVYLDLQSWVCSAHINDLMKADVPAKRHFFVPYNWVSASSGAVSGVFTRDIVFGRNDELAVVRGGLDLSGG